MAWKCKSCGAKDASCYVFGVEWLCKRCYDKLASLLTWMKGDAD